MNNNYLKRKVTCEEKDFTIKYIALFFLKFFFIGSDIIQILKKE